LNNSTVNVRVDSSHSPQNQQNQQNPQMGDEDEISLIDLLITLGKEKKFILSLTSIVILVTVVYSLLMTPLYTAKTVLMPPQQQQSSAASALASLGALAGLAGGAAGAKSPDEMYVAFMGSDRFLNALIARFHLQERYHTKTLLDTRNKLKSMTKVMPDKKSGLISIEFEEEDPQFAADVANAHVQELGHMLDMLAVTDAQQRRVFFESQIKKVQENLSSAEIAFRQAKEKSGLQVTSVIAETGVRASAELRGQIAAREVQLQSLSRFATPQNPDVQRIASEVSAERAQLQKLEQGTGQVVGTTLQLEAVKSYRDMKVQEAMLEVLIKQFELARVDEAKEGPLIQVVDLATPPERRSKPKRTLIVLVSALAGFFLGVLLAFLKVSLRNLNQTPDGQIQLGLLKKAWSWA
jgi:uncharacterized protein involved in exopolysaccharide biosynthesis